MQNGGHVSPFLIFSLNAPRAPRKKRKSGLRRPITAPKKYFMGRFRRITHPRPKKKNKIKQNLATQGTIGVRLLPFPAFSRRRARKNHRTARFLRGNAAVPQILQAHSASCALLVSPPCARIAGEIACATILEANQVAPLWGAVYR
jgi:hypothetical protein